MNASGGGRGRREAGPSRPRVDGPLREKGISFGIAAALGRDVTRAVAPEVERLGYDALWLNDNPGSPGLPLLAAAQGVTARIRLAVGVIPCDTRPAAEVTSTARELGIDLGRAVIGVGSGRARQRVDAVRAAVKELRAGLGDDAVIAVAALGPLMCRLAGEVADVVLLNWMTPVKIRWARERIGEGERRGRRGRPSPRVASYVRVAIGSDARERLAAEASRYAKIASYARSFEEMGVDPGSVGVAAVDGTGIAAALAPYREVLDETVVRALPGPGDAPSVLAIARSALR